MADLVRVLVAQLRVGVVLDQPDEGARAFGDVGAVLVEELEEVPFARQQLADSILFPLVGGKSEEVYERSQTGRLPGGAFRDNAGHAPPPRGEDPR